LPDAGKTQKAETGYVTVDDVAKLQDAVARARAAGMIAVDTETIIEPGTPQLVDPLRSKLVSISIATAPGEAYYFPFLHRAPRAAQGELLVDSAGDRSATDAPEERGLIRGGDEPLAIADTVARQKKSPAARKGEMSIAARAIAEGKGGMVRNLPALDS